MMLSIAVFDELGMTFATEFGIRTDSCEDRFTLG